MSPLIGRRKAPSKFLSFAIIVAMIGVPHLPVFASQITADSLMGYWKLDEASSPAVDSSGGGNSGTWNGNVSRSLSVPTFNFNDAGSASFDGTGDYIAVGSSITFPANAAKSVSLWFKTTDNSFTTLLHQNSDSIYLVVDTNGHIDSWMNNGEKDFGGSVLDNAWHHLVWTYNGTVETAYLDGAQLGTSNTEAAPAGTGNISIGATSVGAGEFGGLIDEVRIYRRALTLRDITTLYAGDHLTSYWNGTGNSNFENVANWSGSVIPDPYTKTVLKSSLYPLTLTGSLQLAGLTINDGAFLKLNGNNLQLNDAGSFLNDGTLMLKNTETLTNFTNDTSGTVMLMGTGTTTGMKAGDVYGDLILNDGLITYLKFDETSGTRAADSSGYGFSGSLVNGAAFTTSAAAPTNFYNPGSAVFDGSNDYVDTPYDTNIKDGQGFLFSAWVRSNVETGNKLVFDRTQATLGIVNIGQNGTSLYCVVRDDNNATPVSLTIPNAIAANVWTHVACGRDTGSSTMRFYINGRLVGKFAGNSGPITSTIRIGNHQNTAVGWNGYIDDVRIYGRPLLAGEVAALAAGNQPSLQRGSVTLNSNLVVQDDLVFNGGALTASSADNIISVYGDWINNGGVFNALSGEVDFLGDGAFVILSGGQRFNNVYFQGAGSTWTLSDALTASGTLSINAGTLDVRSAGNYTLRAGNLDKSTVDGTFLPRSGLVVLTAGANRQLSFDTPLNTLHIEHPSENGLVGYWKFDEGTNTGAILDSSGRNNTGVRTGSGAVWSGASLPSLLFADPFAMNFNGFNDHVTVADSSSLDLSGDATFATWVNWGRAIGTDDDSFIDKTQSGDSPNYRLYLVNNGADTGKFGFWNGTTAANSTSTISRGAWHHLAISISSGTASYYIDGVLDKTAALGLGSVNNGPLLIGTDPQAARRHFNGLLDDVRIYNRALSAAEVSNLYGGIYADGDSAPVTTEMVDGIDVDKLSIISGVLSGGSENLLVSSEWNNYAGADGFAPYGSTVSFDGTGTQTVRGSSTFSNLTIATTIARTINFAADSLQSITNNLTLTGQSSNLLTLAPLTAATEWSIDLDDSASQTVQYVSPSYSNANDGLAINAYDGTSVDGNNNVNWLFTDPSAVAEEEEAPVSTGGGGGGHRGSANDMANRVAAARNMITERFQRQIIRSAVIAGRDAGQRQSSSIDSNDQEESVSSSSSAPSEYMPRAQQIAQSRGLLLAMVSNEPILFKDVPVKEWFAPYVATLIEDGIAQGYDDEDGEPAGIFGVADAITYAEALKLAIEAAEIDIHTMPPRPRNTSAQGTWAAMYVSAAENLGITTITPELNVHSPVSRAEVIAIILKILDLPIASQASTFKDVPENHPFSKAIATAAFYGIIKGDTAADGTALNTFRPDETINRAEVAKIIALLKEVVE